MLGLNVRGLNIRARRDVVHLLVQGERVSLLCLREMKVVVFSNSMISEPDAEQEEIADHIISVCPFARHFSTKIKWAANVIASVGERWTSRPPNGVFTSDVSSLILLYLRNSRKHRERSFLLAVIA